MHGKDKIEASKNGAESSYKDADSCSDNVSIKLVCAQGSSKCPASIYTA